MTTLPKATRRSTFHWGLILLFGLFAASLEAGEMMDSCLRVEGHVALPEKLTGAEGIAWDSGDHVLLAHPMDGVYRVPIEIAAASGKLAREPELLLSGGGPDFGGDLLLPRVVEVDGDDRVFASALFSVAWQRRNADSLSGQADFEGPSDLDVDSGELAVLGFSRGPSGQPAPDGSIAWIGSLENAFSTRRPLLRSADGPGIERMGRCALLFAGAIRFTADGNVVIVPGVEPGAFLVDRQGKVVRTWQNTDLGIDANCRLTEPEQLQVRTGETGRWAWLNRHRVVDEILPLAEGPAFVVRARSESATHWELVRTRPGGGVTRCRLPFRSRSERTRLAADLRDGHLAILISTPGAPQDRGPAAESRLIFARVAEPTTESASPGS